MLAKAAKGKLITVQGLLKAAKDWLKVTKGYLKAKNSKSLPQCYKQQNNNNNNFMTPF